ncbi:hypothetical protein BKA69DRAFT_1076087 [Paraphysoderma sedebokerense]|nr:hypothetical protein BKA69DRAFT_1076087 [Paraphysoderma sedebokerense]
MKQPRIVTILQNSSNELQLEIAWLQRWKEKKRKEEELEKREQAARDRGETIDCGCCFADYLFEKMVACEDGHLFCVDCARRNAETIIGYRKTKLKCMSGDDCSFCFPMNEIKRFLPPKLLQGYMRILQEDEIKAAGLEGYKDCPQCYFGAVVDESEKIFACQNPECMFVSCINCRKKNHIPMTCDEYEKENAESKKHIIEEAMTEALLRECPNCKKKFYKVDGCNKMTCTCGTLSCYVCRKVVKGYDHFAQGNRKSQTN